MTAAKKPKGGGFGQPPESGNFQKGQSGNPSGKRKVPKVGDLLAKYLAKTTVVTVEGKKTKMSNLELITFQLVRKAAGGDLAATKLLLAEATLLAQEDGPQEQAMTAEQLEMLQQLVAAAKALKEDLE